MRNWWIYLFLMVVVVNFIDSIPSDWLVPLGFAAVIVGVIAFLKRSEIPFLGISTRGLGVLLVVVGAVLLVEGPARREPELLQVLFLMVLPIFGLGLSVWGIVDAARRPASAWEAAHHKKVLWIVLLVLSLYPLLGLIFSLWYFMGVRPKLRAAQEAQITDGIEPSPSPSPGSPVAAIIPANAVPTNPAPRSTGLRGSPLPMNPSWPGLKKRLAELADEELGWMQTRVLPRPEYELRAGDELAAVLRFESLFGSSAIGESAEGCWSIEDRRKVTIRTCTSAGFSGYRSPESEAGSDIAQFTWGEGLGLPDGRKLFATTIERSLTGGTQHLELKAESGETLLRFNRTVSVQFFGTVEIQPSALEIPELPWIVMLSWHLAVRSFERGLGLD